MNGSNGFVIAAYTVMWVAVFHFVQYLWIATYQAAGTGAVSARATYLGKALLADSQPVAAEVAFNEALRLGVDRAEVCVSLAEALNAQGKQRQMLADPRLSPDGLNATTRRDLLPPDIAAERVKLQDRVPPFPGEAARQLVSEALGAPIDQLFRRFDTEPLAAASITHVHAAELPDGRVVSGGTPGDGGPEGTPKPATPQP